MASTTTPFLIGESKVDSVLIDSLVVMRIVKAVDSELYSGMSEVAGETCAGILTGLISDKTLEITNCFPTPRSEVIIEGGEEQLAAQAEDKQIEIIEMLKRFRTIQLDYELVGFYQAHLYGAFFTQEMVESLVDYQSNVSESVVLIYDPVKTRQGELTLQAFRLSKKALELSLNGDWSPESLKGLGVSLGSIFQELPVTVRNSNLMSVMLAELAIWKGKRDAPHLELGTRRALEKSLRSMQQSIDELNKSTAIYNKYSMDKNKFDAIYQSLIQKRAENEGRIARGEQPLSLDEIKKQFKSPQLQLKGGMLDLFLNARYTDALANYATAVTGENVAKIFLSEAVAGLGEKPEGKERIQSISRP